MTPRRSDAVSLTPAASADWRERDARDALAGPDVWRDEGLQGLTQLVATVLAAPMAAIALDGEDGQPFRSGVGFPASWVAGPETPLAQFCRHVVASGRPFVVPDARGPSAAGEAFAAGDVVAYLGTPLVGSDGRVLGALCVFDRRPRSWRDVQVGVVANAATVAARLVELRGLVDASARPRDRLPIAVVDDLRWPLEVVKGQLQRLRARLGHGTVRDPCNVAASLREIEVGTAWLEAQLIALLPDSDREAAAARPRAITRDAGPRAVRPSGIPSA